jgi:MFS transporter, MHS family, proline/betaine transporter
MSEATAIGLLDTACERQDSGLTGEQRKNLALASLGSLLEFYEFMVFGFFTVVIGKLFFPPDLPEAVKTFHAFALFSLGFLLRPLSGAVIGHLGDKFGRKKMFVVTVLLMAVPTTCMGLMPTYAQIGVAAPVILLILRVLQGIAIAGEFAGASVFVAEHVPADRLATASGWLLGSSYVGFFLGASVAALMANLLDPLALESWGWRLPFLLGGVLGLVAVYLRRQLDETPMFKEVRSRKDRAKAFPFTEALRHCPGRLVYVAGLGSYLGMMIIILYFYMPSFLQTQYGFDRGGVFTANSIALLVLAFVCPLWGRIADRIGYGWVLGVGATGLAVTLLLFFENLATIAASPSQLLWWYVGFSLLMATAATVPALSAISFPTEVRLTGFGFGYNVGIVISATAPTIMAGIILSYGKAAIAYYAASVGALGVLLAIVTFWLPLSLQKEHAA